MAAEELRQAKELMAKLMHDAAKQQVATAAAQDAVSENSQDLARAERSHQVQRKATEDLILGMKMAMDRGAALEYAGAALKKRASGRTRRSSAALAADAEKQNAFEAKFMETRALAASLFHGCQYQEAARLYTVLITSARAALNAKEAPGRDFAEAALPNLLSNRSACYMDDSDLLEDCVRDCDDCLDSLATLGREGGARGDGGASSSSSSSSNSGGGGGGASSSSSRSNVNVSAFKVLLRRAEANRRLGRIAECSRQSEALRGLARTDDEHAAAGYLSLQMAVIHVE